MARFPISMLEKAMPFFREIEHEMETVVRVLQPGPLGILEQKFSAQEISRANATVVRAIENWQANHSQHSSRENNC